MLQYLSAVAVVLVQIAAAELEVPITKKVFRIGSLEMSFYTGSFVIGLFVCVCLGGIVYKVMQKTGDSSSSEDDDEKKKMKKETNYHMLADIYSALKPVFTITCSMKILLVYILLLLCLLILGGKL